MDGLGISCILLGYATYYSHKKVQIMESIATFVKKYLAGIDENNDN